MVPEVSAMIAASFGRRASNSSATRGRPPVMSRVLALSVGIRAMTSPAFTLRARIDRDDGVDRELVARLAAARELEDLAVLVLDHDRRTQVRRRGGAVRQSVTTRLAMPVNSSSVSDIDWPSTRSSKRDRALDLGEDRPGVRIPLGDALAALDLVAVVDQHARAVLDAMHGALGAVGIEHRDDHVAAHGDGLAVGVLARCSCS